jgi:predicted AAA+ superfamily ATPase
MCRDSAIPGKVFNYEKRYLSEIIAMEIIFSQKTATFAGRPPNWVAMQESRYRKLLENADPFLPLTEAFHVHLIDLLRQYYFVGGMPEAVKHFAAKANGREIRRIQQEIIKSYVLDFAKHAPAPDIPKLTRIWDSIPMYLAREYKKFVFSALKKGARAENMNVN